MRAGILFLAAFFATGCNNLDPTSAQKEQCRQTINYIAEISDTELNLEASGIKKRIDSNCGFLKTNKEAFREMALEHFYANITNADTLKIKEIFIADPEDSPADPLVDPHGFILTVFVQETHEDEILSAKVAYVVTFKEEEGIWLMGGH